MLVRSHFTLATSLQRLATATYLETLELYLLLCNHTIIALSLFIFSRTIHAVTTPIWRLCNFAYRVIQGSRRLLWTIGLIWHCRTRVSPSQNMSVSGNLKLGIYPCHVTFVTYTKHNFLIAPPPVSAYSSIYTRIERNLVVFKLMVHSEVELR